MEYTATKYGSSTLAQPRWLEKHFAGLESIAPYTCEFLGTFFLTFTVICCSMYGSATWSATAIAFVFMAAIYATSPLSGGHLNPAVSLACWFARKITFIKMLQYIVVQLLAGVFAGVLAYLTFYQTVLSAIGPVGTYNWFEALLVECVYTGMLCFVVLNCAASERNNPEGDRNQFYALAIGFVIIAGGYAAGGISGAFFNPAVAVAVQFCRKNVLLGLVNLGWYCMMHAIGAIGGALCFVFCRLEDFRGPGGPSSAEQRILFLTDYRPPLSIRLIAEFIGTFMLVFTFALNLMQGNSATAWSTGACATSMMYSLSNVSGGHFNPAITLGVYLGGRNRIRGVDTVFYMLMQFCAGVLTAAVLATVFQSMKIASLGLGPSGAFTWAQAFCAEGAFTLFLVYVVLAVATVDSAYELSFSRHNFYYGFAIGACYAVGGIAIGAITGGSLNPASSLGLATEKWMAVEIFKTNATATTPPPTGIWVPSDSMMSVLANGGNYIFFEVIGALLAAAVFHCTHAKEYRYWEDRYV